MERNNENRNRYNNDRNEGRSDQYNNWNQSSDFRESRNQDSDRDENQWDNESRYERRGQQGNYGQYSGRENRDDFGSYEINRKESRLRSMGSLGNDSNRYSDDQSGSGHFSNYSGSGRSGNYGEGQMRNNDYGNRGRSSYDSDYRNSGGRFNDRDGESRNWWDKTKDEVSGWFGDEDAQQRRNMDQRGEHRGKGPKGYTRTDERIKEDVHERLTDDGMIDATNIEVDVKSGEVFLRGTVKNRNEKRRAEDIIENISGVKNVDNHIKVQSEGSASSQSSSQYGEKKFGTSAGSGINAGAEINTRN